MALECTLGHIVSSSKTEVELVVAGNNIAGQLASVVCALRRHIVVGVLVLELEGCRSAKSRHIDEADTNPPWSVTVLETVSLLPLRDALSIATSALTVPLESQVSLMVTPGRVRGQEKAITDRGQHWCT